MLQIGESFEGYVIRELLGRGTFGSVYEVEDANGNHWALKVFDPLPNIQVPRDELKRRFSREVRYQSAIEHPNVVKVVLHNLEHDPPYFMMELADCSLLDLIRDKKVGPENAVSAIADVLTGLEAMHAAGYKHRDLKPGNVLAFKSTDPEKDYRFAISDFGLIAPPESDTSTLTATGVGGGTIDYAAPEAMKNLRHVTLGATFTRWALFCTISMLASGESRAANSLVPVCSVLSLRNAPKLTNQDASTQLLN